MTIVTVRWNQVRDLFERVLAEEPPDPIRWLDQQAGVDAAIRGEVISLLEYHGRTGRFLAEPALERLPALFDDDAAIAPGVHVGPYLVEREIGRGGMGQVFLARDSRLNRLVALKALPAAAVRDPRDRERLRREARAAAALTHPGICTIYALEENGDDIYIVSEYVDGQTLREAIADGTRPSGAEALDIARALAGALASAHANGIVHRDIKPENVMRRSDGQLKILDFGLARVLAPGADVAQRMTAAGAVIGTPAYMAPEQLNGGEVGPSADVFALGVLLYELAAGEHPFAAPTALGVTARILESEPRPIETLRPDLPDALSRGIARSLRKAPHERYGSAGEMLSALSSGTAAPGASAWWRTHQVAIIGLYLVAAAAAWQLKEWQPGLTTGLFMAIGVGAAIGGIFRGHLLFTERMNRASFNVERRRAEPVTLVVDLAIAAALAVDGLTLASRPLASVLTMGLAVGIALARLVLERATAAAAFGD